MQHYILEECNIPIPCFTPLCIYATFQFILLPTLHSYFHFNALCLVYLSHFQWVYHIGFMPTFSVMNLGLDILSYTSTKISKLLLLYHILWNVCPNIGIWIGIAFSSGELFGLANNDTVRPINLDDCGEKISSFNRCSMLLLVGVLRIE